jgi:hypothetical protein
VRSTERSSRIRPSFSCRSVSQAVTGGISVVPERVPPMPAAGVRAVGVRGAVLGTGIGDIHHHTRRVDLVEGKGRA